MSKGPFGAQAVSCEYLAGPRKTPDTGKILYLILRDTGKTKSWCSGETVTQGSHDRGWRPLDPTQWHVPVAPKRTPGGRLESYPGPTQRDGSDVIFTIRARSCDPANQNRRPKGHMVNGPLGALSNRH
ncbi:hypothetical protein PCASD_08209 [Puccinia coronata f. sp. avenae]|uniref:Uncharacterized protein n=1 Tax=Puccinia coronata f. sp. avenae TaxID=200324 RepID=A0A2N5ULX5_9BASI|nr:hypothetical protein PCASD_08209 [Puccinia coronata f. sp. avenae]